MISIIIPIFNVEKYLNRCLISICNQSLKDWEALLIDDGSTDRSGEICDSFAYSEQRFKVIHQKNEGLSGARNTGLRNAQGDYVCFVDGDDYIHPQFLEIMFNAIVEYDSDLVASTSKSVSHEDDVSFNMNLTFKAKEFSQQELFVSLFYIHKKFHSVAVWNKLFRKDIVRDILFENTTCEDVEFLSRVYHRVEKGVRVDAQLYFYVQRPGSITSGGVSIRNRGEIDSMLRVLNNLKPSQKLERGYCLQQLYNIIPLIKSISNDTEYQDSSNLICKNALHKTFHEFLINTTIPLKMKLGLLSFNFIPFSYYLFLKFRARYRMADYEK